MLRSCASSASDRKNNRWAVAGRAVRPDQQMQHAVQDRHVLVRRNHIDVFGSTRVLSLTCTTHRRGALKEFGQNAFVCRVEVLDNDDGHAAADRHVSQKRFQRLESPVSTDADDRQWWR